VTWRDVPGSWPLRGLFWAVAIFAFVMAVLPHPPRLPGEPSDKIQHVVAFATLTLLGSFAYTATGPRKLLARLSLFGAVIEIVQMIPALHRDADVMDWAADTIAVLAVLALLRFIRGRAKGSPASD